MKKEMIKQQQRSRRKLRVGVKGNSERPRLSVYRSLNHIYSQIIDDSKGITLAAASDLDLDKSTIKNKKKTEVSIEVGRLLAKKAKEKSIGKVVFDKGFFKYHGRVKAVADGAREGGLDF